MWIEAILAKQDLDALAKKLSPLSLRLGDGQGDLTLFDPRDTALLAGEGLRLVCKGRVHWALLGIHVPVLLHSLALTVRPRIVARPGGDTLVFDLHIDHADLAGLPTIIDNRVTEKINEALAAKHVELAWNFAETLRHSFKLPDAMAPVDALALSVAWGEMRITADAVVLALSFHSSVTRRDWATESVVPGPSSDVPPAPRRQGGRAGTDVVARLYAYVASGLVLVAGGYALFRAIARRG
jgi:hypothetical protein